jgi:hypothetical protein
MTEIENPEDGARMISLISEVENSAHCAAIAKMANETKEQWEVKVQLSL